MRERRSWSEERSIPEVAEEQADMNDLFATPAQGDI